MQNEQELRDLLYEKMCNEQENFIEKLKHSTPEEIISASYEKVMRDDIIFRCTECGNENYIGTKNKRNHPDRMEIKKYCKKCNKKTVHKEKK